MSDNISYSVILLLILQQMALAPLLFKFSVVTLTFLVDSISLMHVIFSLQIKQFSIPFMVNFRYRSLPH